MKLKARFSEYVKSLFPPYCMKCGSNEMCSLHHIYGTKSASMFAGIKLCHNHHKEADNYNVAKGNAGKEFRKVLVEITRKYFEINDWYTLDEKDKERNKEFLKIKDTL